MKHSAKFGPSETHQRVIRTWAFLPIAPHIVQPFDGNDSMVMCVWCARGRTQVATGKCICADFVPSMAFVPRHCDGFTSGAIK